MRIGKRRISDRAGYSLIHAVILIAVLPVLLMAATTWVHKSMIMSNKFKHRRETNVVLNHFSNQFQNDVHASKSLNLNSDLKQVELTGHEDQMIVFQIQNGQINKTLTVDGEVVGRESFRLSDEYFAEWDADAGGGRAALSVSRYPTPLNQSAPKSLQVPDPKLELVITAKVNRWNQTVKFGRELESGGAE